MFSDTVYEKKDEVECVGGFLSFSFGPTFEECASDCSSSSQCVGFDHYGPCTLRNDGCVETTVSGKTFYSKIDN